MPFTNLQQLIRVLNPSMSISEIALAERIMLGKRRLLPHGALPKADFRLPKPTSQNQEHLKALHEIISKMIDLCYQAGYQALAATQVGMHYPIIVIKQYDGSFVAYTHPRFKQIGHTCLNILDGCGSLLPHGSSNSAYFAKYPTRFEATYTSPFEYKTTKSLLELPFNDLWALVTRVNFMHEVRHLLGLTAANGFLVNFDQLTEQDLALADGIVRLFLQEKTTTKLLRRIKGEPKVGSLLIEYLVENQLFGGTHVTVPGVFNQPKYVETSLMVPDLRKLIESL